MGGRMFEKQFSSLEGGEFIIESQTGLGSLPNHFMIPWLFITHPSPTLVSSLVAVEGAWAMTSLDG